MNTQIILKIQNGRLLLFFPYNAEIIGKLQQIPSARFEKLYKAWSLPLTRVSYQNVVDSLEVKSPEIEEWLKKTRKKIKLSEWKFKTKPLPHQVEGIKFLLRQFNVEVVK